jgi:hypothetical protein
VKTLVTFIGFMGRPGEPMALVNVSCGSGETTLVYDPANHQLINPDQYATDFLKLCGADPLFIGGAVKKGR